MKARSWLGTSSVPEASAKGRDQSSKHGVRSGQVSEKVWANEKSLDGNQVSHTRVRSENTQLSSTYLVLWAWDKGTTKLTYLY